MHDDMQKMRSELHGIRTEILRLERMIHENEKNMLPVVEVYKKILASSEVGGFVAKVLGGVIGLTAAIVGIWVWFKDSGGAK